MKIKNSEVLNCTAALIKLNETRFPSAAVSITVLRNAKKLDEEKTLILEARQKLLKEYCKTDDDGNLIIENGNTLPEDKDGLEKAHAELFDAEVEINLKPLSISDLDSANLTPSEINTILFMIEGENDG